MIKRDIKEIYCGIYKITCLITGKIYIGQSVDIFNRWIQYHRLEQKVIGPKLYNSFIKYGLDNHVFEIIEECIKEQLNIKEINYIKQCNSFLKGLNLTEGGEGVKHTDETKKKISDSKKGKISPMKGKIRSYKGRISPNKGNKRSKESCMLTSLALKGKPQNGKSIIQSITNQEWISAIEAGKYFSVTSTTIHNWVKINKNNLNYKQYGN
jgi:group I intron endonuclease